MTIRWRRRLGAIFFALMFVNLLVSVRSAWPGVLRPGGSYDGWISPDGVEITYVDQSGPAIVLKPGDVFVSINGLTRSDDPQIVSNADRIPPGAHYKMTVRRQGQLLEFDLVTTAYPLRRRLEVILLPIAGILSRLLFYFTGLIVFLLKPADRQAWLLSLMLGSYYGLYNTPIQPAPVAALLMIAAARISGILFLPTFLHFFLVFPEQAPLLRRYPRLERWLYLPAFLALPWFAFSVLEVVSRAYEPANLFFRSSWALQEPWSAALSLTIGVAYVAGGLLALFTGYRLSGAAARRKLHLIAAASGAGMFCFISVVIWGKYFRSQFPGAGEWLNFGMSFTLPLIPLSFAYAIIRHQVIPVSLIIRRGARYVLVSRGSIVLGIVLVGLTLTALLSTILNRLHQTPFVNGMVSAVVGVVAYNFFRSLHHRYLAPVIDRRFFRQAYDTRQILADLTESLRTTISLDHLLELVATKIQTALQAANVTIFLREVSTDDYRSAYSSDYVESDGRMINRDRQTVLPYYAEFIKQVSDNGLPLDVENYISSVVARQASDNGQGPDVNQSEMATLIEIKSALLFPLSSKGETLGVVSLGPRLGDLPYSREDEQLLMSVAGPATLAIENARLVERMLVEAGIRQELEAENEIRAKELEEARQLQLSMLPQAIPQLPQLEIAAYMKPAAEVGGDYYDFHLSDAGLLTVAVGDATGHGLKAGTVVTATKSLFNHLAQESDIPAVLRQSSRALKRMNFRSMFMAMAIAKVNGYQLRLSSAGMPPVLIYRAAQRVVEKISLHGVPLGSLRDYLYREHSLDLVPGDVVVMMSDGLPERFNREGGMFDYSRTMETLTDAAARSPREIIERLAGAGEEWAGGRPQDDDVTFVVLKVK
ncbi:MAG TPA: SpoIIE family protein phosphatase [Blastocatellia bacterium]|nr:SpoIIE family protein phosphatase [Blastocatellia bacterium]